VAGGGRYTQLQRPRPIADFLKLESTFTYKNYTDPETLDIDWSQHSVKQRGWLGQAWKELSVEKRHKFIYLFILLAQMIRAKFRNSVQFWEYEESVEYVWNWHVWGKIFLYTCNNGKWYYRLACIVSDFWLISEIL
jgi:hypothetical protein